MTPRWRNSTPTTATRISPIRQKPSPDRLILRTMALIPRPTTIITVAVVLGGTPTKAPLEGEVEKNIIAPPCRTGCRLSPAVPMRS